MPDPRRPAGDGGVPLGAGRRRGPPEHERVAVPAAAGLARGARRRRSAAIEWHRYPDRSATGLRAAIADWHGVDADQVFAANGSNEVLQTLLLTYAGPGRSVLTFEPTYQLHAHIARITGATVVEVERGGGLHARSPATVAAAVREHRPTVTFLCSPNNPTGIVEDPAVVDAALDASRRARRRRRGLRPVRRVERPRPRRRGPPARRRAHVLQDVEHGGGPPRLPRRAVVARRPPRGRRAAVPPRRRQAGRRHARPAPRRRDGRAGEDHRRRARAARRRPARAARRDVPERRQLRAVPGRRRRGDEGTGCGRASSTAACSCATAPGWPRLGGCLRVTIGTPQENDRFLAALREVLA